MTSNARPEASKKMLNSLAIVDEVAKREGVPVMNLQPPLYDVIDPDALETLLGTERSRPHSLVKVQFEYAGYSITVDSDGTIKME